MKTVLFLGLFVSVGAGCSTKKLDVGDNPATHSSAANGGAASRVVLASNQAGPTALTVMGPNVYFLASGTTLYGVPVAGGATAALGSAEPSLTAAFNSLANDGSTVYWANYDTGMVELRTPKGALSAGANGSRFSGGARGLSGIAVNQNHVYWANAEDGTISAALVDDIGARPTVLYQGAKGLAALAADGTNVFIANSAAGTVVRVPVDGSAPTTLASGRATPQAIVSDASGVYWVEKDGLNVMKVAAGSDALITLATVETGKPIALALDESDVYWANLNGIQRVAKSGGDAASLVDGAGDQFLTGIAVDGTHVYWSSMDGTINRMDK